MTALVSRGSASPAGPVIAMVAGEVSGDLLGADLIKALRRRYPQAHFVGIGGPRMLSEGFQSIVPMERLSVMGLVEVLGRLRELFRIRARVRDYCVANRPAILIGIDSPDFTLGLEKQVREAGIPTAHYVSPSVWAWRQGRVKGIARSVDLMLTLLPFEARFYRENGVPVRFVGHPMADQIPWEPDQAQARLELELPEKAGVVALLPGSRGGEVGFLGPLFLKTARWLADHHDQPLTFVVPCINPARQRQIEAMIADEPEFQALDVRLVAGQSREIMTAADVVLLASGTATLEAALLKRPMVVAYQLKPLTHWIVSRMVRIDHIALPNLLAPQPFVPEFIQDEATPEAIGAALMKRLSSPETIDEEQRVFADIHRGLQHSASDRAAEAISALIDARPLPPELEADHG